MVSATVANVNALLAIRAQPANVRYLRKAAIKSTTRYAMAEAPASVIAVSVMRDTSVHIAKHVLDALTPAKQNCKYLSSKVLLDVSSQT